MLCCTCSTNIRGSVGSAQASAPIIQTDSHSTSGTYAISNLAEANTGYLYKDRWQWWWWGGKVPCQRTWSMFIVRETNLATATANYYPRLTPRSLHILIQFFKDDSFAPDTAFPSNKSLSIIRSTSSTVYLMYFVGFWVKSTPPYSLRNFL